MRGARLRYSLAGARAGLPVSPPHGRSPRCVFCKRGSMPREEGKAHICRPGSRRCGFGWDGNRAAPGGRHRVFPSESGTGPRQAPGKAVGSGHRVPEATLDVAVLLLARRCCQRAWPGPPSSVGLVTGGTGNRRGDRGPGRLTAASHTTSFRKSRAGWGTCERQ